MPRRCGGQGDLLSGAMALFQHWCSSQNADKSNDVLGAYAACTLVRTAAADAFGLTVEDVKGRAQPQRIVKARHAFVYVAREVLKESFPRIAVALGRDHTTAMSSYRRAQALIERNKDFQSAVDQIRQAVGG